MIIEQATSVEAKDRHTISTNSWPFIVGRYSGGLTLFAATILLLYGLVWDYSTRRYISGFSDAIVPLQGSPEQKSLALLAWLRDEPERKDRFMDQSTTRDPVGIVQDARLLRICGSASNAFVNLAEASGVKTRRLLLLDEYGNTMHVVVEVRWEEGWVVVDPTFRTVFRDPTGRALTKNDLRYPDVFRDAIGRIPNYSPTYKFDRTVHIHLTRIPVLGVLIRRTLDSLVPGWEESINWGYLPEHPSLWPVVLSMPLFMLGILILKIVRRFNRSLLRSTRLGFSERLKASGRLFLQKSA
jgi:hypothetical protein